MNIENQDGLKPGEARTPGQSTRDVIMRDPIAVDHIAYTSSVR